MGYAVTGQKWWGIHGCFHSTVELQARMHYPTCLAFLLLAPNSSSTLFLSPIFLSPAFSSLALCLIGKPCRTKNIEWPPRTNGELWPRSSQELQSCHRRNWIMPTPQSDLKNGLFPSWSSDDTEVPISPCLYSGGSLFRDLKCGEIVFHSRDNGEMFLAPAGAMKQH